MKGLFTFRELSEPLRRRVELAVAVAQERLISTHVQHALRLVQMTGEELPFPNVLDIYARVMRLSRTEARSVTTRALASLGEGVERGEEWPEPPEEEEEEGPGGWRSLVQVLRDRLRGRVHEALRARVAFAAAKAEIALLETHAENALTFVELLEKEMGAQDAAELYIDTLNVRDGLAEVVYYFALSRWADRLAESASRRSLT